MNSKNQKKDNLLIGRNSVSEAIKAGRKIEKIYVAKNTEGSVKQICGMASDAGIPILYRERSTLNSMAGGNHQGIIALAGEFDYCDIEDILEEASSRNEDPFVIICDGIEDPQNLGAIIRSAECAGVHGVIIPVRNACAVTGAVIKASAGACEYMKVAKVVNIARTIEDLADAGLWIGACDMDGRNYTESNLKGAVGLVIGGESKGVGRLVKEKCDFVISVPMRGRINSLNASNAAAILMYEVRRQRDG